MTKAELQAALNVETAIQTAHRERFESDRISLTQHASLEWHSEQRIEAIYHLAATRGWTLELP